MKHKTALSWIPLDHPARYESTAAPSAFRHNGEWLTRSIQMVVDEQIVFNAWRPAQPLDVSQPHWTSTADPSGWRLSN
jgi:hypothetical protein